MFLLDIIGDDDTDYTDDELLTKRQTARHVCMAMKRYFEAHLVIEAEHLRRSQSAISSSCPISNPANAASTSRASSSSSANSNINPHKAARYSPEQIVEYVENLLELMPLRINWKPVDEFIKLGGVKLLVTLIFRAYEWNNQGKAETVKSALDVMMVCSVAPKFQLMLTESVQLEPDRCEAAMRIILSAAEGEHGNDAEVQKSALHVVINCSCGPLTRIGGPLVRLCTASNKKRSIKSGEEILSKMWTCIRANNGIMILLNLLFVKSKLCRSGSFSHVVDDVLTL